MTRLILTAALLLTFIPVAFAQQPLSDRDRGDRACRNDAVKLCRKVLDHGDFAILACFQQNARRLTRGCRTFLVEMGQLPPS